MRRLNDDERGSVVVITAVVFTALFGIGAVVIDMGALLHEKRVLQNGADAGVLAIAEACGAATCTDPFALAAEYADENAQDGASGVESVCGSGIPGVAGCADPPALPAGANYVRVTTDTEADDGGGLVPFRFGHVFGVDGMAVRASAVAAWGGPRSLTSALPVTISECEFDAYTNNGADLGAPPPYDFDNPYPLPEAVIYLHDTTGASPCQSSSSGADLPGGFGWLSTSAECDATSDTTNWFDDKTGRPPPQSCTPALMSQLVGTVVAIPVFDQTNGLTGTNGDYHMVGFGAFYVTGYSIEGQYKVASLVTNSFPCQGQASCISGFFVQDDTPITGTIGGPAMGVTVVSLIG